MNPACVFTSSAFSLFLFRLDSMYSFHCALPLVQWPLCSRRLLNVVPNWSSLEMDTEELWRCHEWVLGCPCWTEWVWNGYLVVRVEWALGCPCWTGDVTESALAYTRMKDTATITHVPFCKKTITHVLFCKKTIAHIPFCKKTITHVSFCKKTIAHVPFRKKTPHRPV